jgi:hypothetical protein
VIKDGVRLCDVCAEIIPKGTTYAVHVLSPEEAKLLQSLNNDDPEFAPTFALDSDGNARLDVCLDCKANMGIQGEIAN